MKKLTEWLTPHRAQYMLGALIVPLLIFLFVQSNDTGRARYEAAEDSLARIEALDLELNALLFPLLFETQTNLDDITRLQAELRRSVADYEEPHSKDGPTALFERIAEKLQFIDDLKAQQAVTRNSRAAATDMLDQALARSELADTYAETLLREAESHFFEFVSQRNPPSMAQLRETISQVEDEAPQVASLPEWQTFALQAETAMRYSEGMTLLLFELFSVPVPQQIAAELDAIETWFAVRSSRAANYRVGMFAVALVLLGFSAHKVLVARRYYRMIERSNAELEHRVAERTDELSKANRSLQNEIRERTAVESQLRVAQKLESIGQLAAGIAHEVNTPTQYAGDNVAFLSTAWKDVEPVLDEYERILEGGALDAPRARAAWRRADVDFLRSEVPAALSAASDGLEQIGRIVRAIKDFSHPGDESLRPEDINHAIENAVTVARNEWKYVARMNLELDSTLPRVPCNISAFNQVILNLIVNAAQAIETAASGNEFGTILIRTRPADDYAEIVVEDDGPGIPEALRERVFDPFFTTKEVGKGTGQGLAIAFRVVVNQHGGTLSLSVPESGRGARLTIRLPLEQADEERPIGEDADLTDSVRVLAAHVRA